MLKKSIAISLIIIFVSAYTEIGQLLKIPQLVNHYWEHSHETDADHDMSFLVFIKGHYSKDQSNNNHKGHQGLPFKTLNQITNMTLALQSQTTMTFINRIGIPVKTQVPFSDEYYTSTVFASIWLPPKLS